DTDLFQPLIKKIEQLAGIPYKVDSQKDIAFRVIADHVRAVSCAIADGQLPSNVKAGYVIRRILRRAIRYGYQYLNITEPFIYKISQTFIEYYHKIFPELKEQADLRIKVINQEEISFLATLERGIKLFDQYIENHKNTKIIDGQFAFELYDTYGFPIDLTQLMAKEKGLDVDITKFEEFLNQQRQRSRQSSQIDTEDWIIIKDGESEFVGYDTLECPTQIIKYRKIVKKNKTFYHLILEKTPFYAESGGQVGDTGIIYSTNETITILNTIKEYGQIIHISDKIPQDLQSVFIAKVDIEKRLSTMKNHSATHLLHYALRQLLGQHIEQKGSLVHPDYLRFDFSHYEKIPVEQLNEIEKIVNKLIQNNYPLEEHRNLPYQQAINMGAMALFGEKYGDHVRLIKFGDSKELCGGTHVKATGDIGCFKIINETAVASGIRRIEAITGMKAIETFQETFNIFSKIKNILKTNNPLDSVKNLIEKNKELTKQNEDLLKEKLNNIAHNLIDNAEKINDVFFIGEILNLSPDQLRQLSFILKTFNKNIVAVIAANKSDKANVSFVIADEVIKKYNFNTKDLINIAAPIIHGKGGGQPNMAIMGGENKGNYQTLIKEVKTFILEKTKA
ncbi:MAG: alanyl-tRNA synthetase, partial [Rikenellaceae bacterium]|nr:alanyl-tRNA synthetase [Rikenellaceae bacterium]